MLKKKLNFQIIIKTKKENQNMLAICAMLVKIFILKNFSFKKHLHITKDCTRFTSKNFKTLSIVIQNDQLFK